MNETSSIVDVLSAQWIQTFVRYALFSAGAYLIFWKACAARFERLRLYPWPARSQIIREILNSIRTTFIFVLAGGIAFVGVHAGWLKFYWNVADHGWAWFFGSVIALIVLHDAFFYWVHRAMHHPKLFRHFHRVHHESLNPTPFAALSFDVPEALVQSGIIPLTMLFIPLHGGAIFIFLIYSIVTNVYGHLGIDLNSEAHREGWMRFFTSPRSHSRHHQKFRGNYGLYFTYWDRWMDTEIPEKLNA